MGNQGLPATLFRETQQKKQVVYNSDNTITYVNQKTYFFDESLSCSTCRKDDVFTLPNIPYLVSAFGRLINGVHKTPFPGSCTAN